MDIICIPKSSVSLMRIYQGTLITRSVKYLELFKYTQIFSRRLSKSFELQSSLGIISIRIMNQMEEVKLIKR